MINLHPVPLFLLLSLASTCGQPTAPDPPPLQSSFRTSVALVIGIFSSLTFLLLVYVKFCYSAAYEFFNHTSTIRSGTLISTPQLNNPNNLQQSSRSGIDKSVIESLPFFRFSALKGSHSGLECVVCLSKFDDEDVLRLLPKCKHAFHIKCVDKWLECHSTCPLCRYRIDPDDVNVFKCSNSSRFLVRNGDNNELENIEIFVEQEPDDHGNKRKKDEFLIPDKETHRFKHRIILSDLLFKSRWSDMNSMDLVSLNSHMLNLVSSKRFKINNENSTPTRCMSEITNVARFHGASNSQDDENVRRVWLPIAQRTVQLFTGKGRGAEFQHSGGDSNV